LKPKRFFGQRKTPQSCTLAKFDCKGVDIYSTAPVRTVDAREVSPQSGISRVTITTTWLRFNAHENLFSFEVIRNASTLAQALIS
jgi:hypothetical protein